MPTFDILPPDYLIQHPIEPTYNNNILVGEKSDLTFSQGQMTALKITARVVELNIKILKNRASFESFISGNFGRVVTFNTDVDIFHIGSLSFNCWILGWDFENINSVQSMLNLRLRYDNS